MVRSKNDWFSKKRKFFKFCAKKSGLHYKNILKRKNRLLSKKYCFLKFYWKIF